VGWGLRHGDVTVCAIHDSGGLRHGDVIVSRMAKMRNEVRRRTLQMTRKHYHWFPFPVFPLLLGDFIGRAEEELWREDGREAVLLLPRHRRPAN
jgi:hypothetical protein